MEIVFNVPAERVAFMLEMLGSISYVRNPRPRRVRSVKKEQAVCFDRGDGYDGVLTVVADECRNAAPFFQAVGAR